MNPRVTPGFSSLPRPRGALVSCLGPAPYNPLCPCTLDVCVSSPPPVQYAASEQLPGALHNALELHRCHEKRLLGRHCRGIDV
jgi:hypothetical protein